MSFDSDLLIVGGGLNGPAMALACAQAGMTATVIDSLSSETRGDDGFDGRAYALALASQRLLGAIGLWPSVAANAQPILDIVASDGRAGEGPAPYALHFDHAEIDEGPMGYMLEDRFLRQAVLSALQGSESIAHLSGETVVAQEVGPASASVTLASGQRLTGRLLIGADGRQSGTAKRAGIGRQGHDYGQTALVCAVAHERPHNGVAHQFFMPNGPLAILPLPGDRCSIVWSEARPLVEELIRASAESFLDALRPRFGDFLGQIALEGDRFAYPLNLTLADRTMTDRIALIGDAAQGMHPIAGQGLNQGLRDVGTLAQVLAEARRRGEDIGSLQVLDRYRAWRSFDRQALAIGTDLINKLFSNDNPLLRAGRDLGLGLVNALPGLRRGFIREAAGLSGDVPKLLQGRPV